MEATTDTKGRVVLSGPVPPARLEGDEVHLDPSRPCTYCGHTTDVARVVRLYDGSYAYACNACAFKT